MKLIYEHTKDLRGLYINNLKKALDMEQKIVKALPELIDKSSDTDLKNAFSGHLDETRGHVSKVEALLQRNTDKVSTASCKVIGSLTSEASDITKEVTNSAVRDIALIGAAQQVEHHEIAVYGTIRRWAEILGMNEDAAILKSIEWEETKADKLLSDIANRVNTMSTAA